MTAGERAEAKRELVLAGRVQWWRELMKKGKVEKAAGYAARYGFSEVVAEELEAMKKFEAVIGANPESESPAAYEAEHKLIDRILAGAVGRGATATLATLQDDRGELRDGWPVKAEAVVQSYPHNKRMVLVRLKDGREAVLWNHAGGRWTLGSKVIVTLDEVVAGESAYYTGEFHRDV